MDIIREAFLGGERLYCQDCGSTVEENFYPTSYVGSSAQAVWEKDQEQARKEGIFFSGYSPCDCCQDE